ncbi:MAG: thioesterase domain-containing protein [Candidatus Promineifilaceae bacterium]
MNRPRLTAQYFLPDPFGGKPGARLYRSGDFARYRPDGNIDFIGRRDQQVKIRGYRIELGEIEILLHQHEKIDQATVEVRYAAEDDARLVAYIVPRQGMTFNNQELQEYLARDLPGYMIPAVFITLEQMPLTANLKVDREALPEPGWGERSSMLEATLKPRDEIEKRLAAIWHDLLKFPEIGIKDNFFDLGGHSLLVIQMMNRVESEFGRRPPLTPFLEEPTIEQLTAILKEGPSPIQSQPLVAIRESGFGQPLFIVTAGYNDLLTLSSVAKAMKPNRPIYIIQPSNEGNQLKLERSLDDLLDSYIAAVQSVQVSGPYQIAGFCSGGLVAFALAERFIEMGEEVKPLILMDTPLAYPRRQHFFHRTIRWFLSHLLRSETPGLPRRTALSGPLFSDAGLVIHLNALSGYRASSYAGKIMLIVARDSHIKNAPNIRSWQEIAVGEIEAITVPGDHNSFASGQRAAQVAAILDSAL